MRYRVGAAIAGLICTWSAAAPASQSIVVGTSMQGGVQIVHVLVNGSIVRLRHEATTSHEIAMISPAPASACRSIAMRWNVAIVNHAGLARYQALFRGLAHNRCPITFIDTGLNPNGTSNLLSATPGS